MIVSSKSGGNYAPCPEFIGRAVCVDVTDTKTYETDFGTKEKFKIVFEVDLIDTSRDPHQPWCVFSKPMVASLHEKAALAKFLREWFGRKLSATETASFDLETLIGKPAQIVIGHEPSEDGTKTYANIKLIQPHKVGDPLQPSGLFVRLKDRPPREDKPDSTYRRAPQSGGAPSTTDAAGAPDHSKVKVHVGRNQGIELRELTRESINSLIELWLPKAKANPKPTADDKRLMAALQWYADKLQAEAIAETKLEQDEIPY
jgi:hypothetical protein